MSNKTENQNKKGVRPSARKYNPQAKAVKSFDPPLMTATLPKPIALPKFMHLSKIETPLANDPLWKEAFVIDGMASHAISIENELLRGKGRIEVILGPMFSGKTTELLRRMRRYQLAKFKCLVFKYTLDCRYSATQVATHDLQTFAAVSCSNLEEYRDKALEYDVIGIDEGQFFNNITPFTETLANLGKVIVVAALDGTYQRVPFGNVLNLVPLAESVIKLNAICMNCYNNASFTKRISNEKAVEIIGGADKYMAVCRECYHLREIVKNDVTRTALKPLYQNN